MSIWISKRATAGTLAVLCLALSACGGGRLAIPEGPRTGGQADASVAVAGGDVVIAGPNGFCVDPGSSRTSASVPFVTLGNCASIANNARAPQPGVKAVLTASVGPEASGQAVSGGTAALDPFFRSEAGRTELSRDLNPATVSVLETFHEAGVFYLRLSDTSNGALPDVAREQWRGYLDVNGRLVSTTVLGFNDDPLSATEARGLIRAFTREIRTKSAGGAATAMATAAPTAAPEPAPARATAARPALRGLEGVGIFRRLLGGG